MKTEKNTTKKIIKSVVTKSLMDSANTTSCILFYQPKAPAGFKKLSKIENDK